MRISNNLSYDQQHFVVVVWYYSLRWLFATYKLLCKSLKIPLGGQVALSHVLTNKHVSYSDTDLRSTLLRCQKGLRSTQHTAVELAWQRSEQNPWWKQSLPGAAYRGEVGVTQRSWLLVISPACTITFTFSKEDATAILFTNRWNKIPLTYSLRSFFSTLSKNCTSLIS